jgi:hypothetical protein
MNQAGSRAVTPTWTAKLLPTAGVNKNLDLPGEKLIAYSSDVLLKKP